MSRYNNNTQTAYVYLYHLWSIDDIKARLYTMQPESDNYVFSSITPIRFQSSL